MQKEEKRKKTKPRERTGSITLCKSDERLKNSYKKKQWRPPSKKKKERKKKPKHEEQEGMPQHR
jgi:hypothetical protein